MQKPSLQFFSQIKKVHFKFTIFGMDVGYPLKMFYTKMVISNFEFCHLLSTKRWIWKSKFHWHLSPNWTFMLNKIVLGLSVESFFFVTCWIQVLFSLLSSFFCKAQAWSVTSWEHIVRVSLLIQSYNYLCNMQVTYLSGVWLWMIAAVMFSFTLVLRVGKPAI